MTRALRRDHRDGDAGRRGDEAEADVEAVGEEQRVAVLEAGGDLRGEEIGLHLVGGQDHDDVGLGSGLRRGEDAQALLLGPGTRPAAGLQADPDVDARVPQVQRVGVALRAVADDGDLATLDDRKIRVLVVEHFSCH
ncbi:hypothetical protein SDC9_210176 [bioreactor metagenome]|uniref:Uncharacterized protein n=1 Tax=bioreactor metagenome TaxID=1076179 RepID=A0A645JFE9_9ZZZZ